MSHLTNDLCYIHPINPPTVIVYHLLITNPVYNMQHQTRNTIETAKIGTTIDTLK